MTEYLFARLTDLDDITAALAAHIADTAAAHAASAISSTPAGNLSATTVQAALDELDAEKVSAATLTESVQDIIGAILTSSESVGSLGWTYDDTAGTVTATIKAGAVAYAQIQNISATARVLARKSASAGVVEETTLSELLDFIGSAAEGDILYRGASAWARLPIGTTQQMLTVSAGLPAWAAAPSRRNRLVNGGMRVWQEQNTGAAAVTDGLYSFDGWYHLNQSAGVTVSQVADAENTTPWMLRITQANAGAQRFGVGQIIEGEDCRYLRGQLVTLSARVRCSNSTTLRYAILEWTSTEDSVTKDCVNDWTSATYTAGNFFLGSNYTVTATGSIALTANTLANITALSATLGSSFNNVVVFFWTDSTQAQNSTLDIGKVQLEAGPDATAFERLPLDTEIARCERFYWKTYDLDTAPGTNIFLGALGGPATQSDRLKSTFMFRTRMRAVPAITIWDPFASNTPNKCRDDANNQISLTTPTFDGAAETGFRNIRDAGGTPFVANTGYNTHVVADARL